VAKDLDTAKKEFWDQVKVYAPDEVKRFKPVLDDLITWSAKQTAIQFTWHEGTPGSQRQSLVKYCLPEMDAAFWAVYPHSKDGAFLIVLADPHHRFPDDVRHEARRELAVIDRRPLVENEFPTVKFLNLIPPKNRQRLLELMEGWLARILPP
jgi:hypothetical protein